MRPLQDFSALLFDLDGVITPTAEVHRHAWRVLFEDEFARRGVTRPYTEEDYFLYLDGKQRYEGVAGVLASRGIDLPEGDPADASDAETVCGLGNRKNDVFASVLADEGVAPYPGSVRLLDAIAPYGIPQAVVSSSKNAEPVLVAAGLRDRFPLIVDGVVAAREGLASKPDPAMFLAAARHLDVAPGDAVVFEDAISGVAAGRAGGFGHVVGVDRGAGEEALLAAGAHTVVADLDVLAASIPSRGR